MTSDQIKTLQQNLSAKGFFCETTGEWDAATASAWFSWASVNNVPRHARSHQPAVPEQTYGLLDSTAVAAEVKTDAEQQKKDAEAAAAEQQRQLAAAQKLAQEQAEGEAAVNAEIARQAAERAAEQQAAIDAAAARSQQIAEERMLESGDAGLGTIKPEAEATGGASDVGRGVSIDAKTPAADATKAAAPTGKVVINRQAPTSKGGDSK